MDAEDAKKSGAAQRGNFRVWENEDVEGVLKNWRRSRGEPEDGPVEETAPAAAAVPAEGAGEEGGAATAAAGAAAGGEEDVHMD